MSKTTSRSPKTPARSTTRSTSKPAARPASTRRTTPSARATTPARRGTAPAARAPRKSSSSPLTSISPERKLDILGIVLALAGLLTLLSLVSTARGSVTGAWLDLLRNIAGVGTFILPVALLGIGLWLIFRHIDRLPQISAERLAGLLLVYINLLGWIHLFAGGGWEPAAEGKGGGYIGALVERGLVGGLGKAGAVVVLLGWLLVSITMALDLSIPDLFRGARRLFTRLFERMQHPALPGERVTAELPVRNGMLSEPPHSVAMENLPPGFHPLPQGDTPPAKSSNGRSTRPSTSRSGSSSGQVQSPAETETTQTTAPIASSVISGSSAATVPNWALPSIEAILDPGDPVSVSSNLDKERAKVIEETLASFGAPGHVVDIQNGPAITLFALEPDYMETRNGRTRVRVSKIVSLADDLALALAASRIRIQAPVPGRNYVGIEVPNTETTRVALRDVMESDPFRKIKSTLKFALGKNVSGAPIATDLAKMPHLLIAGTTGSGKSVCVNSILCCLLLENTPAELRLVLVDPKRVELTGYNGIPHLLAPVVVEAERVIGALQWMLREMDARYHRFAQAGVRNIEEYNKKMPDRLPYLVIVIDELADLMMLAPDETERSITRLAQLARATGIHMILATQRPSVDVVTGLIKANFPARVAFAVASGVDSRVILDQPGAERLLGRGDMLFQAPDAPAPVRLQGVFVADSEINRLVEAWRMAASAMSANTPAMPETPVDLPPAGLPLKQPALFDGMESREGDPLYEEAVELIRREGRASISMLQRRMRIGYTRAARLIDRMEESNIIGPPLANTQVREVLDYGQTAPPEDDGA